MEPRSWIALDELPLSRKGGRCASDSSRTRVKPRAVSCRADCPGQRWINWNGQFFSRKIRNRRYQSISTQILNPYLFNPCYTALFYSIVLHKSLHSESWVVRHTRNLQQFNVELGSGVFCTLKSENSFCIQCFKKIYLWKYYMFTCLNLTWCSL